MMRWLREEISHHLFILLAKNDEELFNFLLAEPVVSQHTQWGRSVGGRLVDDHRRIVVDDVRHRLDHMVMSDAISPPAHLRPMVAVTVAGGVDCAITVMSTSNPDIGEMGRIRSRRFALSI
ncbi:unnamed protein product [Nippostrongylus brasiliensis]|uniref:Transcriptional regulator n=1 Tax=Nippostrongylus brasiliensis TaxID=27835 RepID=A0A0N4Y077_NIPBR|nr:unnamed protein product [Nippostrongylus brasiliensis]